MIRKTKETEIEINLEIEGKGKSKIDTKINFLNHMLELFTKHGAFNLEIKAKGDLEVDQHHLVEDIGITLGQAFDQALGDKKGINRAGFFAMPMDEALAILAIDIGGRPYLKFEAKFKENKIGDLDSELIHDFFEAFSNNLKCNIHVRSFEGRTDHHKAEALFKAFGRALKMACSKDKKLKDAIPSTKGLI
ncbi:MAG: Imidazoleglycerol-phosphate dehydratase [Candidatus Roizmanbacteria bacterium GW2011_GWA2_37_7]|uniref:Imidazoleglycerol-phosphate dehydratase n=1 Tax=Candidatus Roizmanbacteria bacterium GW2011_GWA2_37_7 TaxID=1618481 RepID=A0A0G0GYW9_9BACT|nr:MAG: Imidazoleglycerol-phosphate dehydratase [Candidatus Roizmanbacteria bacterium GW2011_GWA2_37_7]